MQIRVTLVGSDRIRGRLRALGSSLDSALAVSLEAAALPLENAWKDKVANFYDDAGYTGPDGKRGLVETGTFLRSIHHEPGDGPHEVLVGSDIVDPPYPAFLEFGTSRMEPKPTARPALDESGPEMRSEFNASMRQLLGSIG